MKGPTPLARLLADPDDRVHELTVVLRGLDAFMTRQGLSGADVARQADIDEGTVSKLRHGTLAATLPRVTALLDAFATPAHRESLAAELVGD